MVETQAQRQARAPFVASGCRPDAAAAIAAHLHTSDLKALRLACRAAHECYAACVRKVRVDGAADLLAAARCFPHLAFAKVDSCFPPRGVAPMLAAAAQMEQLEVGTIVDDELQALDQQPRRPVPPAQPRLHKLRLSFGQYSDASPGMLALARGVQRLPALRELDLQGIRGNVSAPAGAFIAALPPGLTRLTMNTLSLHAAPARAAAATLPQALRVLHISDCHLDRGTRGCAATLLGALPPALRQLRCEDTILGPKASSALARRLPALTALTELRLINCKLYGKAPAALVGPQLSPHLRVLHITNLGSGARWFAALASAAPRLTALEALHLQVHEPLVKGAEALIAILPASLQTLVIFMGGYPRTCPCPRAIDSLAARLPVLRDLRALRVRYHELGPCDGLLAALPASLRALELDIYRYLEPVADRALAGRMPTLAALEELTINCGCGWSWCNWLGRMLAVLPCSLRMLNVCIRLDAAPAALAGRMPALTALEELKLDCTLGVNVAPVLSVLPPSLRELRVLVKDPRDQQECSLDPDWAAALVARAPALVTLRRLRVALRVVEQAAALRAALPAGCKLG